MKAKWRMHELILITSMALITIGKLTITRLTQPHLLLPQAGSLLLIYAAYLWINYAIVPMAVLATTNQSKRLLRIISTLSQFFTLTYVLGPGVNFISYYFGPNYKGFDNIPLTFGYHPQPFQNVFGGWGVALLCTSIYCLYAMVREVLINYAEAPAKSQSYRVLVSNQMTALAAVVLCVPFLLSFFQLASPIFYRYYFALAPSIGLIAIGTYYWLFVVYDEKGLQSFRFLSMLFFYVMSVTAPFSLFLGDKWTPGLLTALVAIQIMFTLPVSWFLYIGKKDVLRALAGFQTELARSNADLQALRSQINPHFLFNALNSLYAISLREGSPNAASGIQQLGDMMRFMLYDNQKDFISMDSELNYLTNYIALQRLRVQESDNMLIDFRLVGRHFDFLIVPMLLIPFVENAFKHGIRLEQKSWIIIELKCENKQLNFIVRNSIHSSLINDPELGRSGIGLQNVQDRLQLFYPGRHELYYGREADEFMVTLKIKINS